MELSAKDGQAETRNLNAMDICLQMCRKAIVDKELRFIS